MEIPHGFKVRVPIRSDQLNPIFPINLFMVKIVFYRSKGNIIIFHKEQFVAKIDIQAEKTPQNNRK